MKILIWIPARGGSKRIPNKNIKVMNGKPLLAWSIDAALNTNADEVWVDSDDNKILKIADDYGAKTNKRLSIHARDTSMTEDALLDFTYNNDFDAIIMLECTAPLINSDDLQGMIDTYKNGCYDSVTLLDKRMLFVNRLDGEHCFPVGYNPYNRIMSQNFKQDDWTYCEAGAYLVSREWLLKSSNRMGGRNGYFIKHDFNYDIDNPEDFKLVEEVMKWTKSGHQEMN
jgi:CMP-N,N'-diacetyllegionaminic acid synthase